MIVPFMTLDDDTEILYSEMLNNGEVKVYIETLDEEDGFLYMTCYLPSYRIDEIFGYNEVEKEFLLNIIKNVEYEIIEAAMVNNKQ